MAGVLDHVRQGFLHDAIGRELDTGVDWAEVAELLIESYCVLAPRRLGQSVERPDD